jgi:hypothetical protein
MKLKDYQWEKKYLKQRIKKIKRLCGVKDFEDCNDKQKQVCKII